MVTKPRRVLFLALGLAVFTVAIVVSVNTGWRRHSVSAESAFFDGDYVYAEKQFLAAVAKTETFGPQDPRLAVALTDLASFYYFVGRYRDAEKLIKRSLKIERATLDAGDPRIATSMFNLVNVYVADSRLGEARSVAERALAIQTQALGADDPSLAEGLDIYASALEKAGRTAQAAAARRRANELLLDQAEPGVRANGLSPAQ